MAFRRVGVAARDQPLDERDHLHDVLGGAGFNARRQATDGGGVRMELRRGLFGKLPDGDALLRRAGVDLVVNVGDVANVFHMIRPVEVAEQPEQHVEHDERARIADMREVVNGRAADIHAHALGIERLENFLLPGPGIVKLECHKALPWLAGFFSQ